MIVELVHKKKSRRTTELTIKVFERGLLRYQDRVDINPDTVDTIRMLAVILGAEVHTEYDQA